VRRETMIEVYTDGATSGNPGKSGAGIYIKAGGKAYEHSVPLGILTNHQAEFKAIITALEICHKDFPGEILSFRSDSKVAVDVIEKDFTKNKDFLPLLQQIRSLKASFPYVFIKWIPDKQNGNADRLARKALHML